MRKMLPILLSALMFTGCAGTSNNQTSTYRQISMEEAVSMMAEETGYHPNVIQTKIITE